MPSLAHHVLVDLFREQPALIPHLLAAALGVELPRGVACRVTDSNLDRLRPVERRADLVLELTRRGRPVLSVIVEVQRRRDARKWLAWLDYLISKRRRSRACVLVIATDARVAAWAARPFDLGPGNEALRVWVLGPGQIAPIVDPDVAREHPDLAFLSALTHAITTPETLAAAFAGFPELPGDRSTLYYRVLSQHLPAALRPTLEAHAMDLMKHPKISDPFRSLALKFYRKEIDAAAAKAAEKADAKAATKVAKATAQITAQITAEAARQCREAEKQASLEQLRATLLRLMTKAGLAPTDAHRRKVEACNQVRQLDRWIDRVLTAETARDVFATTRRPKHSPPKPGKRAAAPKRARRAAA